VSEIETLRRDPYALYARYLLGLAPLDPLDPAPDARDRGTLFHAIFEAYSRAEVSADPALARQRLRDLGAEAFRKIASESRVHAFWWAEFLAILPEFVAFDARGRREGASIFPEVPGRLGLAIEGFGAFALDGRADRIERDRAGRCSIIDYKTGSPPSRREIDSGLAPQLPLLAAIARRGGFRDLPPTEAIAMLGYFLSRGKDRGVQPISEDKDAEGPLVLAEREVSRLKAELLALASGARGYVSQAIPRASRHRGPYDHLARVGEWGGDFASFQDEP
jgi:ATP-dependent helicase/nuclease subunit B